MNSLPTTVASATDLLNDLNHKRSLLNKTVSTAAARRKEHVVAAELGDTAAAVALLSIDAEESRAETDLRNLDTVIDEVKRHREKLRVVENEAETASIEEQRSALFDQILAIDDDIDDGCDYVREQLARRAELARHPLLRSHGAAPDRDLGKSLLQYFHDQLFWTGPNTSYAELVRFAQWDARRFGRDSVRMTERPPRELTAVEKNMARGVAASPAFSGSTGFDSTIEAAKHHAKSIDVSGGMARVR